MSKKSRNRKHSIIDTLKTSVKDTVEQMLLSGSTYSDIVDYLRQNEISISVASVCRYARAYNANVEMLNIASENFRRMMDEMNKYPDLDTSEALIRLASQNIFNALSTSNKDWSEIEIDKLLRESTALIKATAYKKRIEVQNQGALENSLNEMKSIIFEAMSKERPDLYKQVNDFLVSKKLEGVL